MDLGINTKGKKGIFPSNYVSISFHFRSTADCSSGGVSLTWQLTFITAYPLFGIFRLCLFASGLVSASLEFYRYLS